eukprot:1144272_1
MDISTAPQKQMTLAKKLYAMQGSLPKTIVYIDGEQEEEDHDAADNLDDTDVQMNEDNEEDYPSNDDGNISNNILKEDVILAGEYVDIILYLGPLFLTKIHQKQYVMK